MSEVKCIDCLYSIGVEVFTIGGRYIKYKCQWDCEWYQQIGKECQSCKYYDKYNFEKTDDYKLIKTIAESKGYRLVKVEGINGK